MVCIAGIKLVYASDTATLMEYLMRQKTDLQLAIQNVHLEVPTESEYQKRLVQNRVAVDVVNALLASLNATALNQQTTYTGLTQRIKWLQQSSSNLSTAAAQEAITRMMAEKAWAQKALSLTHDDIDLAQRYRDLLFGEQDVLKIAQSQYRMNRAIHALNVKEDALNKRLQGLYAESSTLSFANGDTEAQVRMLMRNQRMNMLQYQIAELQLQKQWLRFDYLLNKKPDITTLQAIADNYQFMIDELTDIGDALKRMAIVLKHQQTLPLSDEVRQNLVALSQEVGTHIRGIGIEKKDLDAKAEAHQILLKKQLSVRQNLNYYRLDNWSVIGYQLSQIPKRVYQYLMILTFKVRDNYVWQDWMSTVTLWTAIGGLFAGLWAINHYLKTISPDKLRSRLSGHLYDGLVILLIKNRWHLTWFFALLFILYASGIPFMQWHLLCNLIFIWLVFRNFILIVHRILLEKGEGEDDDRAHNTLLYQRTKWLIITGGWITAFMVFSDELPLSLLMQDMFNRLFMVFLMVVSIIGWHSKEAITYLLLPRLENQRRYVRHAVKLIMFLIPMTLFVTAIVGLVGYMNFAWVMSKYQVQVLVILFAYVLLRGLLFDLFGWLSDWMIHQLHYGWLWIEVFLKPADKICRFLAFLGIFFVLFQLLSLPSQTAILNIASSILAYPLVDISGIHITGNSIISFLILFAAFFWIAKWTREFCYRWLYRNTKDLGVRNSISVFTQYGVVIAGGLVSLRALGLDFAGMSMILGGLAVGMGFGLRDFASNIIGGFMLLIERPVQEGDLVTVGEHEGRVCHIGIRSMRISSWDNMEVLIPNAETFNRPFINWTHQDSTVREVVPIKINRCDSPAKIQALLIETLKNVSEVLVEPAAQVFLKRIDEALVEFEIRYFINVDIHTRFEARSKVLFAIMAAFEAAHVQDPIPPIAVEILG